MWVLPPLKAPKIAPYERDVFKGIDIFINSLKWVFVVLVEIFLDDESKL